MCVLQALVAAVSPSWHPQIMPSRHFLESNGECAFSNSNLASRHDMREYNVRGNGDIIELRYRRDVRRVVAHRLRMTLRPGELTFCLIDQTSLDNGGPLTPPYLGLDVLYALPPTRQLRSKCWARGGSIEFRGLTGPDLHVLPSIHEHKTASQHTCAAPDGHEHPQPGGASESRETELYDAALFCSRFYSKSQNQKSCFHAINGTAGLDVKERSFNQHHDGKLEPRRRTCVRQPFKAKSSGFN